MRNDGYRAVREQNDLAAALLESLRENVLACDSDGSRIELNDVVQLRKVPAKREQSRNENNRRTGMSPIGPDNILLYKTLANGNLRGAEMVSRDENGRVATRFASGRALYDGSGQKIGAVVVMQDVPTSCVDEKGRTEQDDARRNFAQTMSDGFVQLDRDGAIVFANESFCRLTGYDPVHLVGMSLVETFFDEEHRRLLSHSEQNAGPQVARHYELDLRTRSGEVVHVLVSENPAVEADGSSSGTMQTFTDITKRKKAEQLLLHNALHDCLTGLANRNLFMEHLTQRLRQGRSCHDRHFAVVLLDLDGFNQINDSLGHAVGDLLLKDIADRLHGVIRRDDVFSRLGGDEFAILMGHLQRRDEAVKLAGRLQQKLTKPFLVAGRQVYISASIGISYGRYGTVAEQVVQNADIAMYRAKARGPANVQIFDRDMHEQATRRLHLETELRYAAERGQLQVNYQPIVNIETGNLRGFEALVRWDHPELGMVPPGEFIPFAEERNLIVPLGRWVLATSCRQLQEWQAEFPGAADLRMNVNLSVKEFLQSDLADQVGDILSSTGLLPEHLKLEVTESHVMENSEMAVGIMDRLRLLGVHLSLDDFGTGYSSLAHLHRLPVNFLKIDRSFIERMLDSRQGLEIVNTIIRLAHNLRMRVVAEGVETGEQLEQLQNLGCEFAQGYFFARPLPAGEATAYIRRAAENSAVHRPPGRGNNVSTLRAVS